jgi:hypothetical protein
MPSFGSHFHALLMLSSSSILYPILSTPRSLFPVLSKLTVSLVSFEDLTDNSNVSRQFSHGLTCEIDPERLFLMKARCQVILGIRMPTIMKSWPRIVSYDFQWGSKSGQISPQGVWHGEAGLCVEEACNWDTRLQSRNSNQRVEFNNVGQGTISYKICKLQCLWMQIGKGIICEPSLN